MQCARTLDGFWCSAPERWTGSGAVHQNPSSLPTENLMSVLFEIEPIAWQASPGERARKGPERGENLSTATTAALPLERPALRAARHETRREERPVVTAP